MKKKTRDKSRPQQRLDIRTVAASAGVSVATVSRVINKVPTVAPALNQRVWEVIHKLGYVPNTQARALVSGRSRLLGVIISDITNPFFPELIQGFEDKAVELGYETLISSTNYDLHRMEICVQRMLQRKVDGVAVMTFGIEEPLLDRLASQGIPMVFVDLAPQNKNISTIPINYERGITEAVQHLVGLGHSEIAFIAGPKHLHSAKRRLRAFRTAIQKAGLRASANLICHGDHTIEGGTQCMEHLLSLTEHPTAVMCSNDMSAIGAMHAISRSGLSIPSDISLIGFDDIHLASYILPPLTTIRMSGRDIAEVAVKALVERDTVIGEIPTSLIVRQTTAVPAFLLNRSAAPKKTAGSPRANGRAG